MGETRNPEDFHKNLVQRNWGIIQSKNDAKKVPTGLPINSKYLIRITNPKSSPCFASNDRVIK